jgi:hypothetical protein
MPYSAWFKNCLIPAVCTRSFFQVTMSAVRATFGSTLRSLALNLPPNSYRYALTPSPIFPRLKHLSIALMFTEFGPCNDISDLLRDLLVPFVNDHHPTIEHLNMSFTTYCHFDVSPYLRGIRHLPRLRKLGLDFDSVNMDKTSYSGLRYLLEIHSDELRELFLNFPLRYPSDGGTVTPSGRYQQAIGQVALPHLESLNLGTGCAFILGQRAAYLQQFHRSLTTLILDHKDFSYDGGSNCGCPCRL